MMIRWMILALAAMGCGSSTCEYDGETYERGDSFPATDGWNTCSCEAKGDVVCTDLGCLST